MSWLYSQALVVEFLGENSWDGEPCARLSGSHTPHAYLPSDRMMDFSHLSQYGMTFAPLTEDRGAELLTWFRAGFHAKTSAWQERAPASRASDPACGWKWPESSVKYDPAGCSWKTRQHSLLGGLIEFSETWPRSGLMLDGECWELPRLEPITNATASGLWAIPRASCGERGGGDLLQQVKGNPSPSGRYKVPTPTAWDATRQASKDTTNLFQTSTGIVQRRNADGTSSNCGLVDTAINLPTPGANDWKSGTGWDAQKQKENGHSPQLRHLSGGQLNPAWIEWLMGWPLGWTELEPRATDKYRYAQQTHGAC